MSREALAAFFTEVANDPHLQKELVTFAARHGYDFTADELSESDLAAVSGVALELPEYPIPLDARKKPAKK